MAHRKEVFQSKVLQKLYRTAPKQEKEPIPPCFVETLAKKPFVKRKLSQDTATGDGGTAPSAAHQCRRVYTALPPPADCKTGAEGSVTLLQSESINSDEDPAEECTHESSEEPDQEVEKQKRRRRGKRKQNLHEPSVKAGEAGASESSAGLPLTGRSQTSADEGGERLSRNKRRKLKKKRHKEKLLSMGLVPRAAALEFTYQREGNDDDDEEEEEEEEKVEEERRAAEVSHFLRTTMELYISDCSMRADKCPLLSVALEDLLSSMARGSMPSSLLRQLHHLKALVQQKQPDILAEALEELHSTSSMSPEETTAVASLFQYWITDILPMQRDTKTGPSTTPPQGCQSD